MTQPNEKATTFKAGNRVWDLGLNYHNSKQVQKLTEFDFREIFKDKDYIARLYTDQFLLAEIVIVLCEPQFKAQNMTQDDFESILDADLLGGPILDALLQAILFFCPPLLREPFQAMLTKQNQMLQDQSTVLLDKINSLELDQTTRQKISDELDRILSPGIVTSGS